MLLFWIGVVENDDFKIGRVLPVNKSQTRRQRLMPVSCGYDDTNQGLGHVSVIINLRTGVLLRGRQHRRPIPLNSKTKAD